MLFVKGVVTQLLIISVVFILSAYSQDRLHISFPEEVLQSFNDKVFVRVYQTVFKAIKGADSTSYPPATESYKDIYQDREGRVIIYPGKDLDTHTWVGIGDPRNQEKFIKIYKSGGAKNPLIRSFLVDYEVVRNMIMSGAIQTDGAKKGFTMNVDRKYANQFGLNRLHTDELRKNAVPDTLITYTTEKISDSELESKKHWGKILSIDELETPTFVIPDLDGRKVLKETKNLNFDKAAKINDNNFFEKIEKAAEFKRKFERAKAFVNAMDYYSEKLIKVYAEDSKKEFNQIKKYRTPKDILSTVYDPQFERKIQGGFLEGLDDFKNSDMLKMFKHITKTLSDGLPSAEIQTNFNTRMEKVAEEVLPRKYQTEIIVQMGDSDEVKKASEYLFERYEKEGKKVKKIFFNKNDIMYSDQSPDKGKINFNEKTRLSYVGHGSHERSNLMIGGQDALNLADHVSKILFPKRSDENVFLGKVSLVACNSGMEENTALGSTFGQRFIETLSKDNIQTMVSVRVGELQVSSEGHKIYGTVSENSFRKLPPVLVQKSEINGISRTEYGVVNMKTLKVDWQSEIPKNTGNTKVLITSENFGSFDISNIAQKTLKTITSYGETSGTLNVQKTLENQDSPKKIQQLYSEVDELEINARSTDDMGIESVLMEIEAEEMVSKLTISMSEVIKDLPEGEWIPIIDTAEKQTNGKTKVSVVNLDTSETKSVLIESDSFLHYKKRSRLHAMSVHNLPSLSKTSIGMSGTGGILGIGGFVMSIIQLSRAKKCEKNITCPSTESGKRLAKALEINAYIGFSMATFGFVGDSIQIAELAVAFRLNKAAIKGIATITKSTSQFLKFSKVFGAVGMGVGSVGSVVSLGFSAYMLAHAQTKTQKIEFGIQVGIDSVGVVISSVAIGSTIVAATTSSALASSIASATGPIGLAVAVVGILTSVITGLVFEFKNTRKNAQGVGEYFYTLDQVYSKYGMEYIEDSKTLKILQHAIVDTIDFETGTIKLDSQYIFRTKHGSTGSGKINYFFWYKDFPEIVWSVEHAINIRSGIGHSNQKEIVSPRMVETLILPAIPKSYIGYKYSRLPGCTTMHDKGFDTIRRLEYDKRFDYDFYICPGEQTVSSIDHAYVNTTTRVHLTSNVKTIFVPDISDEKLKYLHNKYTFDLSTKSNVHMVIMNDHYKFILRRISEEPCTWYLKFPNINADDITFKDRRGSIRIKNVDVEVVQVSDKIYVMDEHGGNLRIYLDKSKVELKNVIQEKGTSSRDLQKYLDSMDRNLMGGEQYIIVSQFRDNDVYIGRAFYDIKSKVFLYTKLSNVMVSIEFRDNVQLLGRYQNHAYFMSVEKNTANIWSTDTTTKLVETSYMLYCGNTDFKIAKITEQAGLVYLRQNIFGVSLIYMLYPKGIKLAFIDGEIDQIKKLGESCFPALNKLPTRNLFSSAFFASDALPFPGGCVYATTDPLLPIKRTLKDGTNQRFWLYMNDTHNHGGQEGQIFCANNHKPPAATGVITPHIEDDCTDLSIRHIGHSSFGEAVYYFYCEGDKEKFYYQIENNASIKAYVPGGIQHIEDFGVIKLIRSLDGRFYKFTGTANFTLAALDFTVIASKSNWKEMYRNASELVETFVPVLGMKQQNGKDLTAWYYPPEDRLIILSPSIDAEDIIYLGPSPSEVLIWLYSPKNQQIFIQKVLDEEQISKMIINTTGEPRMKVDSSLSARMSANSINSIEYIRGSIIIVTKDGIILSIDYLNATTLLGVNATWLTNNNDDTVRFKLDNLCKIYHSSKPITMGKLILGENSRTHRWYHCVLNAEVSLPTDEDTQPTYLGTEISDGIVYYLVGENIVQINTSRANATVHKYTEVKNAMVRGNTLLIHITSHTHLSSIPLLDNISTLVIGFSQASLVTIDDFVWSHYRSIVISSTGTAGLQSMEIKIKPPRCSVCFEKDGNNTIIKDSTSDRLIILKDHTIHNDKKSSGFKSVENETVVKVTICDAFVTNRADSVSSNTTMVVLVLIGCILLVISRRAKSRVKMFNFCVRHERSERQRLL